MLLSEIVNDGNISLCDEAIEMERENGRNDVDSIRQCYYFIAKLEDRPAPLDEPAPIINYNPDLSVYNELIGGEL